MWVEVYNDWDSKLSVIFANRGFKKFFKIMDNEYNTKTIDLLKENIFNVLKLTSYENTKVVIVGQDSYHGEGEVDNFSFSVQKGIRLSPWFKNGYQELEDALGIKPALEGDLTKWAKEGVLLLNSTLTVIKDTSNSHSKLG